MSDAALSSLSHELISPLNAILGWASLLRRPSCVEEQMGKGLEIIERNARLELQHISDLLDTARILSGNLQLDLQPVTLSTVVGAAVEAVRGAAEAKSIQLHEAVVPVEASVRGDPGRLQQVVMNLLSNAIKFTPRGGRVDVWLVPRDGFVEIVVCDTGMGIAADLLPHVFDCFQQADASTTRRHGGLGLGLTLAKHLIELHGGAVRAESSGPDNGATFTLSVPCNSRAESVDPGPAIGAP